MALSNTTPSAQRPTLSANSRGAGRGPFLTTSDVADHLGVSNDHVLRLIHKGGLSAVDLGVDGGHLYRIRLEDLDALLAARAVPSERE